MFGNAPKLRVDAAIAHPNDEVERRGASPASNEGTLSQSSTSSLAHRRRVPRSLEPMVRFTENPYLQSRLLNRHSEVILAPPLPARTSRHDRRPCAHGHLGLDA